jgi:hypothetical protein
MLLLNDGVCCYDNLYIIYSSEPGIKYMTDTDRAVVFRDSYVL